MLIAKHALKLAILTLFIAPTAQGQATAIIMDRTAHQDTDAAIPTFSNDGFIEVPESQSFRKGPAIRICIPKDKGRVIVQKGECVIETRTDGGLLAGVNKSWQPTEGVSPQQYLDFLYGQRTTQFIGIGVRTSGATDYLVLFYRILDDQKK